MYETPRGSLYVFFGAWYKKGDLEDVSPEHDVAQSPQMRLPNVGAKNLTRG